MPRHEHGDFKGVVYGTIDHCKRYARTHMLLWPGRGCMSPWDPLEDRNELSVMDCSQFLIFKISLLTRTNKIVFLTRRIKDSKSYATKPAYVAGSAVLIDTKKEGDMNKQVKVLGSWKCFISLIHRKPTL